MAQLLVRNVDSQLVERLKKQAAEHGRSAEAEHRAILEETLRLDRSDFIEFARRLREETRDRSLSDSTAIIRDDRDRRP